MTFAEWWERKYGSPVPHNYHAHDAPWPELVAAELQQQDNRLRLSAYKTRRALALGGDQKET